MFIEIPDHGIINTEDIAEVTKNLPFQGHRHLRYVIIMKKGREHSVNDHDYPREKLAKILLNPIMTLEPLPIAEQQHLRDGEWEIYSSPAIKDNLMFKKWENSEENSKEFVTFKAKEMKIGTRIYKITKGCR